MQDKISFSNMMSKNSSLMFSIEQWELIRRLRNSGISRELICRAFDDLDKMDRDLGTLYNLPANSPMNHYMNGNNSNSSSNSSGTYSTVNASSIVNNHFANILDPDLETRELQEFKNKGDAVILKEISCFVFKNDLKQSQIARMAGINQAYVSKFLHGEFLDISENAKTLLYKWYLRFLISPNIYRKNFT
jgi:predicted XRE-type DNA-binding protein